MSKRKLLLADDSITIQKVVNLTFADEGIEVISVGDGDSAMQKFVEFLPDLVMADVNMPGLTGYEICQIIKQNDDTRHIPVILLVGSFEPFDEAEANRVGADDFLTKPFQSIRQLVNKVNDLLNRREKISEEPPRSASETAPPSDIFAETLKFEDKAETPTEFGDAGMDDEMIETSPANDFVSEPISDSPAEPTTDYAKTQPLSAEDLKDFNIPLPNDTIEPETVEEQEIAKEKFKDTETTSISGITEQETALEEPIVEDTEISEEFIPEAEREKEAVSESELDYYAPVAEKTESPAVESLEPETAEAKPFEPETTQTAPLYLTAESESEISEEAETPAADEIESQEAEVETSAAEESETEEPPTGETDLTETAETENAPALGFDDGDLLELPPLVEETGIRPQPQVQQFVSEPEHEVAETKVDETEVAEPQAIASIDTMQSFPPELIEAIAQKVAERISDKAIRDIAWEVVPQITELVIKKMAEEKLKDS